MGLGLSSFKNKDLARCLTMMLGASLTLRAQAVAPCMNNAAAWGLPGSVVDHVHPSGPKQQRQGQAALTVQCGQALNALGQPMRQALLGGG